MSAPFQPGDVVVPVPPEQCRTDPKRHAGYQHSVLSALGPGPRRVLLWRRARDYPGGYLDVSGIDCSCCDGCFRKIDDEVTEAFREQLRKLPVRERVQ